MQTTTLDLSGAISGVGSFFAGALEWMGNAADFVVEHPFVFIMVVCMPVAGVAIGYLKRLIRL